MANDIMKGPFRVEVGDGDVFIAVGPKLVACMDFLPRPDKIKLAERIVRLLNAEPTDSTLPADGWDSGGARGATGSKIYG